MPAFQSTLTARALIAITGADAIDWLQNLITSDIESQPFSTVAGAALLNPQGKILFDFLVWKDAGGLVLECRADIAAALAQRLTFYKLRAKLETGAPEVCAVMVATGAEGTGFRDLRFSMPVFRSRAGSAHANGTAEGQAAYASLRISHGVAESGADYALGDAYPHDINLDQTGGVGFRKGCYVGQEVVSRMQHRGTARRRLVIVEGATALPPAGTPVTASGREAGVLASVSGSRGLAILRLDRTSEARAAGGAIEALGVSLALALPIGATFPLDPAIDPAPGPEGGLA
jgi:tRNA-modifying protein YgfZ